MCDDRSYFGGRGMCVFRESFLGSCFSGVAGSRGSVDEGSVIWEFF